MNNWIVLLAPSPAYILLPYVCHDCQTTAWQLPDNCLTTAWQLPDNCLTVAWWYLKYLMTAWQMTIMSWLVPNFEMTKYNKKGKEIQW